MTPSFWHMLIGDTHNWITLHYLDEGIDTGPIISQGSVEITPDDTGYTTSHRLSEEGHRIFREALPLIRAGTAPRIPHDQIEGVKGSYYSWKPWYAEIQWDWPAERIALHTRTLTPPPESRSEPSGREAYTFLGGHRVRVWEAAVDQTQLAAQEAEPGQVLAVTGQGLLVKAGEGAVVLSAGAIEGREEEGLGSLMDLLSAGLPTTFA
jgi:methionyl-tRNA formyltransferase